MDAHALAFADEVGDFVGIVDFVAEDAGHEFHGEVGFQVGGVVGDDAVGCGVRFVKTVLSEFFEEVEDFVGLFGWDGVGVFAAFDEADALFGHFLGVLFTHGAAEEVGLAEGVTGEKVGGLLDLFLIDENAVGFGGDFFE